MRSGDIPRATEIQSAKSALDAKKIGNMVTPSPSFTANQVTLMTEIIEAKTSQVPSFSEFLKNSKKPTVFVETTCDNFWASGLDSTGTSHTNPKAWPGKNTLGVIIADIASRVRSRTYSRSASASRTSRGKDPAQMDVSQMIQDLRNTKRSNNSGAKKAHNPSREVNPDKDG